MNLDEKLDYLMQGTEYGDPSIAESMAQELRERLAPLGRLTRRVVVGIPLNRLMVVGVTVPAMAAEDVPGFLRIQAEKEFLLAPEEMALGTSLYTPDGTAGLAVLAALPLVQHTNLERALRLAGFRQISMVPAITATGGADATLQILLSPTGVGVIATSGGRIVLLRHISAALSTPEEQEAHSSSLISELRISLSQLSVTLQGSAPRAEVVGQPATVHPLVEALDRAQLGCRWSPRTLPPGVDIEVLQCDLLAANAMQGEEPDMVLRPLPAPRGGSGILRWRRELLWAAVALAVLAVGCVTVILRQKHRLAVLTSEWQALSPRVDALKAITERERKGRAWFSDQPVTLDLLRALTLAFPERGTVWTTRIEVSGRRQVVVAGCALNREVWLQTLDALRNTPGVSNLRVTQARESTDGKAPMTFAFTFTQAIPTALGGEQEDRR